MTRWQRPVQAGLDEPPGFEVKHDLGNSFVTTSGELAEAWGNVELHDDGRVHRFLGAGTAKDYRCACQPAEWASYARSRVG